jgi:hypothetical protein
VSRTRARVGAVLCGALGLLGCAGKGTPPAGGSQTLSPTTTKSWVQSRNCESCGEGPAPNPNLLESASDAAVAAERNREAHERRQREAREREVAQRAVEEAARAAPPADGSR